MSGAHIAARGEGPLLLSSELAPAKAGATQWPRVIIRSPAEPIQRKTTIVHGSTEPALSPALYREQLSCTRKNISEASMHAVAFQTDEDGQCQHRAHPWSPLVQSLGSVGL